ncbi:glycosyltransferase family 39 protein [Stappia sp.]|uniref:ArnT family glycosyltransferase n=1 Tax=Stappia sp. TaxID=1870903 RepID=UPI0025FE83C8|nr:glycosyltransferase family 39 protein [Stappia sp.]
MSDTAAHEIGEPGPRPGQGWLARLFGHRVLAPLALLVLAVLFLSPGVMQVPPLDRDEPRYTQATKQMVESGDFIDIRFQDQARHKKPVGIYWLQSAVVEASGLGAGAPIWIYRIPSQAGAVLAVLLTYWCARAFAGPAAAFMAGALTAATLILGVEARLAKTDAVLLASILAVIGALARIWLARHAPPVSRSRRYGLAALFWIALAVSVLVKGPVGPMVVGLTIVALCAMTREIAWLKRLYPLAGLIGFVALVAPWFIAIHIQTNGAFFAEAVGKDLLGKVATGQESHGAPPLTHLAAALGTFWPLPAFVVLALPFAARALRTPAMLFTLCWVAPTWVVFELTATKLPHYTLPLLPGLAIAAAVLLTDAKAPPSRGWRIAAAALLVVPAVAVAAANLVAPVVLGVWPSPPGALIAVFALVPAFAAMRRMARGAAGEALAPALGAGVLLVIATWAFTMPALSPIWISPRLADAVNGYAGCADPQVANVGFNEPSYIFLQGTDTLPSSPQGAASFLLEADGACRVAVVEGREEAAFLAALAEAGHALPASTQRVTGLNINGGDDLDFGLYRATDMTR